MRNANVANEHLAQWMTTHHHHHRQQFERASIRIVCAAPSNHLSANLALRLLLPLPFFRVASTSDINSNIIVTRFPRQLSRDWRADDAALKPERRTLISGVPCVMFANAKRGHVVRMRSSQPGGSRVDRCGEPYGDSVCGFETAFCCNFFFCLGKGIYFFCL